ncbi:hypothetical protein AXF42_Ash011627 [Apostasia shenzhenica]|uniref:Uncharacterized protein n=1 Tax=Apostasia shenzhenica TaxID=1088818 RepID=A0A2H9ZUJ1_9ASPA|nr:hypothetical protein AXF42_Ash011627 [Apostasia shenzhenica]
MACSATTSCRQTRFRPSSTPSMLVASSSTMPIPLSCAPLPIPASSSSSASPTAASTRSAIPTEP